MHVYECVYVHVYVCVYVRLFPFVFIIFHAPLFMKKFSIKTHSYFSALQVYLDGLLQIQI
jgi:hypothetical protein